MEHIATLSDKDPTLPETWYSFPYGHVVPFKSVVSQYKGYPNTVQKIFPDIQFDINFFQRSSWSPIENRRKFFENYAKSTGFDYLDPEMWYSQPIESMMSFKGADRVISYHENNIPKALSDLFPNIGLDRSKFKLQWSYIGNRRKFFEKYAKENGFDPLSPEEWYRQPRKQIMALENAEDVMSYHKGRISQAIFDIFPSIGFNKTKYQSGALWQTMEERRRFFLDFSRDNKFDPLVLANWFAHPREAIMNRKGAHSVLSHHKNSLPTALQELFPNIGLDKASSSALTKWHDLRQRRRVFELYAQENNFDPTDPSNWYSPKAISFVKGLLIVKTFYQGSAAKALADLFPNMTLDESRFQTFASWSDAKKRRRFFEDYAEEHGFDARTAANWYKQTREQIMTKKGASGVIYHHQNNVTQALLDLFPDIGLQKTIFWAKSLQNRRQFFADFAARRGFDPRDPEKWYSVHPGDIMACENAKGVIYYHKNSPARALLALFPDIALHKSSLLTTWQMGDDARTSRRIKRIKT